MSALSAQRRALRAAMRSLRAGLDPHERDAASALICDQLAQLIPSNASIAATCPLADEPQLTPWLAAHMRGPGALWLPRILSLGDMAFARVSSLDLLVPNRHGILEPPEDAPLTRTPPVALALVPGLAFDHALNRMGQGGGFFDRWLAHMRAHDPGFLALGVCFGCQLLDEPLPIAPHDQPVDRLLTERGVVSAV